MPHQDLIEDPKDARDSGIIQFPTNCGQYLPVVLFIIGVFN